MDERQEKSWFAPISSQGEALKELDNVANGMYIVAVLQVMSGLLSAYFFAIVVAAGLAAIAFLLRRYRSRVAAAALALMTGWSFLGALLQHLGIDVPGGTNVFMSVILLWASIRAIEATVKLNGRFKQQEM